MSNNRDLEYEQNYIGYDEQYPLENGGGIKCKNYELCNSIIPPDHGIHFDNYLCMGCGDWFKVGGFGWNELEFFESDENCSVCLDNTNKKVKFPANCGHSFCVNCSRDILFWDETRYHLSPVPYGCSSCPNGCDNPIKGIQCYCEEYYGDDTYDEIPISIVAIWKRNNPSQYEEWNKKESESIDLSEDIPGSVYGSAKCPICRKKYVRELMT